ncbi:DUF2520 domain-containing protein [soil metagenome]
MKKLTIGILGSGNMAFCLGTALMDAGYIVHEIIARNPKEGKKLSHLLHAKWKSDLHQMEGNADCYFVCLQDNAIASVITEFPVKFKMLIHTSGSISIDVFKNYEGDFGVFYPVQTIKKDITPDWKNTPVCIEANDRQSLKTLQLIAASISKKIYPLNSEQRLNLHLAAVFANNFSNACFSMSEEITKASGLPFDLLRPLILSTALNVQQTSPVKVQTGPAKRNDLKVLKKHQALLDESPELLKIYRLLSRYISEEQ